MKNKISKITKQNLTTYLLVIIFYAVFQTMLSTGNLSRSLSGQLVPICVYIVAAISLNLVVGISGELSLGHAGFLSVGAFSGAVFCDVFSSVSSPVLQLVLSMICAGIVSGIFGLIIGIPVLRLRGDYLAIVTLAFGEIIRNLMNCIYVTRDVDGWHFSFAKPLSVSSDGRNIINGPMGISENTKISTFTIGFALIVFTLFIVLNLMNSRSGRAIMAIRDNRIAAESVGISVTKFKLTAFVISAFLTGMAGTLYGMNYATVTPAKFDFNTSILILVFVVLGGMGNIKGSIIAAALLTVLPEQLRAIGDYRMLIYAVLLIGMMLLTQSTGGKRLLDVLGSFFNKLIGKIKGIFKKKEGTKQ